MNLFILLTFDFVHADHCHHHAQASDPTVLAASLLRSSRIAYCVVVNYTDRLIEFPGRFIES